MESSIGINMETQMLALRDSWLQDSTCIDTNNYSCYPIYSYPVYINTDARPIKLTLSEVDKLRKAAHSDDKLKEILKKFTRLIEVTVDF